MTENRTTELQSLSKLKLAGRLRYWRGIIEIPETELHTICDEIQAEHEQAIAATLGSGTCHIESSYLNDFTSEHECWYEFEMRCGYRFTWDEMEPPNFCPNCGKAVER